MIKFIFIGAIAIVLGACTSLTDRFGDVSEIVAKGRAIEAESVKKLADAHVAYCKNIPDTIRGYVLDSVNGVLDSRNSKYRAGSICIKR